MLKLPAHVANSLTWFWVLLLNQNRNAVCGQHKEEILSQLRELAKKEPDSSNYENVDLESLLAFEAIVPDPNVQPGRMCVGSHCEAEEEPNTFSAFEVKLFLKCKVITYAS